MDLDEILLTAEEGMEKGVEHLKHEMRGVRTGRASPGLVEFVKVDYYGSPTDLRAMALVTVPEPTQLLIKPFDATTVQAIVKAIQGAGLGLNPVSEGKQVRLTLPALSGERRTQLCGTIKQMGEQVKIVIRNARRDANKQLETAAKDKSLHIGEDDAERGKEEIQNLVKKYEAIVDENITNKTKEIMSA